MSLQLSESAFTTETQQEYQIDELQTSNQNQETDQTINYENVEILNESRERKNSTSSSSSSSSSSESSDTDTKKGNVVTLVNN